MRINYKQLRVPELASNFQTGPELRLEDHWFLPPPPSSSHPANRRHWINSGLVQTVDIKKARKHHSLSQRNRREKESGSECVEGRRNWREEGRRGTILRRNLRRKLSLSAAGRMRLPAILAGLLLVVRLSGGEILTPPYFNLAEGKRIVASATCGVDTTGPELYCKLVGANADQDEDINLIQGQVSASEERESNIVRDFF